VILNRVGSPRHEEVLRQACEHAGVPVFGAIPRVDDLSVPSRHLGLITAAEHGAQARAAVEAMIGQVSRHVDLEGIARIAASRVDDEPWNPASARSAEGDVVVALAAGRAFTFGYTEHRELLCAAGAEVVEFDPLIDPLPPRTAALVLPGGFPEQFSTELSGNDVVRQQINALAASGAPVHAECAGLTYLVDELDGYPMCGVLPGSAHFTDRLTLGYRNAVAVSESPLYAVGDRAVGHEFHRTAVSLRDGHSPAWAYNGRGVDALRDGVVAGGVHASYLHTHPAAHPQAIVRFVSTAATSKLAG
jgi:cobyrinic acid a,c-diamide synthase